MAWRLDHANSGFRHMNAIAGFVADSLVYGPGYSFTVKGPSGTAFAWHDAAQAHLESIGASPANASFIYSAGAVLFCWLLLWLLWRSKSSSKRRRRLPEAWDEPSEADSAYRLIDAVIGQVLLTRIHVSGNATYQDLPDFLSAASRATNFRSTCGAERGAPECS